MKKVRRPRAILYPININNGVIDHNPPPINVQHDKSRDYRELAFKVIPKATSKKMKKKQLNGWYGGMRTGAFVLSFIHSFFQSTRTLPLDIHTYNALHLRWKFSLTTNVAKESIQEPGSPNFGFPFLLSLIPVAQWPLHLLWLPYSSVTGTHASHMVPRKKGRRSLTPSFWPLITGSQRV